MSVTLVLAATVGRQPGDPLKGADAIIAAVTSCHPPQRLVLGKYAVNKARQKLAAAARELDASSAAGEAADYTPHA